MKRLFSCERGNIAVVFALSLVPVMGAVGMAVDYTRAVNVRSFIQDQSDLTALKAVQVEAGGSTAPLIAGMRQAIVQRYGEGQWIDDLDIQGKWLSVVDFQVVAKGAVPVTILAAVPGFPSEVPVSASATARIAEPAYVYGPPTLAQLDPEAWDYNLISVYCFNKDKKNDPKTHGRTKFTPLADNLGTIYGNPMPECETGEVLSYQLMNERNAKHDPSLRGKKNTPRYYYYTDTVKSDKEVESYGLDDLKILETVMCRNAAECDPKSPYNILPSGKERDPQRTTESCAPGKYMYYGWEDRPPNLKVAKNKDDSDQDYDDIRIVIGCPTVQSVGERAVRLIN